MEHFYDGQIRRYLTQIVRLLSQFSYKDGKGNLVQIPVTYGDLSRQVGSILRDNSENKVPSAPRMAVYITGLEMDTTRLSDSSYVNKLNIRERAVDANGVEYLRKEGKNYTVERLMPTPYNLSVNVDIWTTNTDQKLQILEQIFMLFNPSLEIQTTDNYIDWTSLSVLNIENINFSSRSIPTGTESEIDVATLGLKTPIYISPPVKVKKLGVITKIITAIFAEDGLEINIDDSAYAQSLVKQAPIFDGVNAVPSKLPGKREALTSETTLVTTSHNNYDLIFLNGIAKLLGKGIVGAETWTGYLKSIPEVFESGITELRLQRSNGYEIIGTVSINTLNETELVVNIDPDTLPDDTYIEGRTGIDYIIDPLKFNPSSKYSESPRILLLGNVGHIHKDSFTTENTIFEIRTGKLFTDIVGETVYVNGVKINVDIVPESDNPNGEHIIKVAAGIAAGSLVEYELYLDQDGPDAWKNLNGTDFAASANDIVEWDGTKWKIVFKAADIIVETFVTNMNTSTQYKWTGSEWILSFEGEYPDGTWRLAY
tara:strand:+ start:2203 stop:3825 length:1623 start_codon:yes stop_codon:yes gene_type:complete